MRKMFTSQDAYNAGLTPEALRWGVHAGKWVRVVKGVYAEGGVPASRLEVELARLIASGGTATGSLAGMLHQLDGVTLQPGGNVASEHDIAILVNGYLCAGGLDTIVSLAAKLNDLQWEQALESALHKRLLTISDLESALGQCRLGNGRIRRVLRLRPANAPPTESLLETLMVQLVRTAPQLPTPARQVVVRNNHGKFVARVDLAWPDHGVFLELDGEQHKAQPVYDANRQTRVGAATGWLVGRFTWSDVVYNQRSTLRCLTEMLEVTQNSRPRFRSAVSL